MRDLSLLLLQGPASPFLREIADVVERRGGTVHKLNVSIGDALFWYPRRGDWFKGEDAAWPDFLATYIEKNAITDILMLGDGRPRHAAAIEVARKLGVRAHVFEHGYLRPDWLTIEPFGMSSRSCFPDDRQKIEALARTAVLAPHPQRYPSSFLTYAVYDLIYHVPNVVLGWALHPHYRAHGAVHPVVEYAGWIGKALRKRGRGQKAREIEARYTTGRQGEFFLFPLQLPGDYQIKRHAPLANHYRQVAAVIASFAAHAAPDTRLLFKIHPIDNGLSNWNTFIHDTAVAVGVADRIDVIDGGNLDRLLSACRGLLTVNSTVGLTALLAGRPVIALGAAIYDMPGLTWQASLADFWRQSAPPDADLVRDFVSALIATCQVRGGFIGKRAIEDGASAMVDRMMNDADWADHDAQRRRAVFRYEAELLSAEPASG